MVRGGLHRLQEPRGEEATGGPAGVGAGVHALLGQEADGLPGGHVAGRARHVDARHHGRICRRAEQRALEQQIPC